MIDISDEYLYTKEKINLDLFILFEKLEVYINDEYT